MNSKTDSLFLSTSPKALQHDRVHANNVCLQTWTLLQLCIQGLCFKQQQTQSELVVVPPGITMFSTVNYLPVCQPPVINCQIKALFPTTPLRAYPSRYTDSDCGRQEPADSTEWSGWKVILGERILGEIVTSQELGNITCVVKDTGCTIWPCKINIVVDCPFKTYLILHDFYLTLILLLHYLHI